MCAHASPGTSVISRSLVCRKSSCHRTATVKTMYRVDLRYAPIVFVSILDPSAADVWRWWCISWDPHGSISIEHRSEKERNIECHSIAARCRWQTQIRCYCQTECQGKQSEWLFSSSLILISYIRSSIPILSTYCQKKFAKTIPVCRNPPKRNWKR